MRDGERDGQYGNGGQGKQDGGQKRLQTGNDMAGICVNGNGKRAKNNAPDGHRRATGRISRCAQIQAIQAAMM